MTERASHLLGELADRLSADSRDSGQLVAESVRTLEPELLKMQKEGGSIDDLVRTSVGFLEILFRSLRADSRVPWQQYYTLAREASRRYAEKGIPLEAVMEGLAVFRRSVMARVTGELRGWNTQTRCCCSPRAVLATSSSTSTPASSEVISTTPRRGTAPARASFTACITSPARWAAPWTWPRSRRSAFARH